MVAVPEGILFPEGSIKELTFTFRPVAVFSYDRHLKPYQYESVSEEN